MYQLSSKQLAAVLGAKESNEESATAQALETRVQRTLPAIDGLDEATTNAERQAIFSRTIEQQLSKFIDTHGSPFGEQEIIEERTKPIAPVVYAGVFAA